MRSLAGNSKERAVDSLEQIYAVVIALAIAQAIENLLKAPASGAVLGWNEVKIGLPSLVALLFTLVPFWHGMNRHLDRCYIEKTESVKQVALLLDFATFLLEAALLFATAWSLRSGLSSFMYLGVLLFVDSLWALVSHQVHFPGKKSHALRWAEINFGFIVGGILVFTFPFTHQVLVLMTLAIVRSIVDYSMCSDFYFPPQ